MNIIVYSKRARIIKERFNWFVMQISWKVSIWQSSQRKSSQIGFNIKYNIIWGGETISMNMCNSGSANLYINKI